MSINKTITELKTDGSLYMLAWTIAFMLAGYVIGYILGNFKVQLIEQTPSGRYATHEECVLWDENCIKECENAEQEPWGGSSPNCACCLEYKTVAVPLGQRLVEVGKAWGIVGAGVTCTIGLVYSENRWRRKIKEREYGKR